MAKFINFLKYKLLVSKTQSCIPAFRQAHNCTAHYAVALLSVPCLSKTAASKTFSQQMSVLSSYFIHTSYMFAQYYNLDIIARLNIFQNSHIQKYEMPNSLSLFFPFPLTTLSSTRSGTECVSVL